MARLEVEIGADIKDFQSKLAKSLKSFDTLKREQKSLSAAFKDGTISSDRYYAAMAANSTTLKKTTADVSKYKSAVNGVGTSTTKMSKGVANGSSAMTAFSRTVQDAPFGMMGVSNNITNLTEQFGYLKARTGSAGGALKAMLTDLKGFGGITLLISLATSAWLVYGDKITQAFDSTAKLKKETKALTEATKGLMGTVGKEISTLNILLKVAKDETISKAKREKAIKKINALYPDYLGNLTLEGVNSKKTTEQVNKLTQALIKQATVKGLLSRISELATKKFDAEQKQAKDYAGVTDKIGSTFSFLFSTSEKYTTSFGKGTKKRIKAIGEEEKKIESLQDTISKLLKDNELDFDKLFGGTTTVKPVKDSFLPFFEGLKSDYDVGKSKFQDVVSTDPLMLDANAEWDSIDWDSYYNLTLFEEKRQQTVEKLKAFSESVNQMFDSSKFEGLSNLGSAIGNAMGSGQNILQAAGASLLGTLGSIMVKYGKLILAYGLASEALKEAMKNPFGGGIAAVVAGVALIAIGSAIKSSSSNISAGGSGGSNAQSGSGSSGGSSRGSDFGGSSGGFSSSSGGGTYVFEIAGTKLVGVLQNTLKRNRNLGGTITL
tara:strand:- start:550 stop:2364 length:1815 start_codon:yes stop_codon:yes gene_type:complete